MDDEHAPEVQRPHIAEKYGRKFVNTAEKAHNRAVALNRTGKASSDNDPPGGYDSTPVPRRPPGFTLKFTFHRASNLPVADFNSFSSDPFVHAQITSDLPKRHKQDPDVSFRTPTVRKNVNPVWDAEWIVANVPASGFHLKCRVYDEDPADHDDRLGNAHVLVDSIGEQWEGIKERSYHIKKRAGSQRAYLFRVIAASCSPRKMDAHLFVSVECLGRTKTENGGRMYTVGPLRWFKHFSPLIGRLTKTSAGKENQDARGNTSHYNFQAIEIQLKGPVPEQLYHRYVEFKPFVAGMFTDKSLRGRILNRALHHQHARIYNFDRSTVHGAFPSPSREFTQCFLGLVDHGRGGRIFTYVLSLDGQFRFTETGKEFGIDLLSKHTMHSNVAIYVAFSGEFFVRPVKKHHRRRQQLEDARAEEDADGEAVQGEDLNSQSKENPEEPSEYELIIDNDSGTYRPNAETLPLLREFFSTNFLGLRVTTLDCQKDEERMKRMKEERRKEKMQNPNQAVFMQQDDSSVSSLSSSDEEDLAHRAGDPSKQRGGLARNMHDMKDVKSKFRNWLGTDENGTVDPSKTNGSSGATDHRTPLE